MVMVYGYGRRYGYGYGMVWYACICVYLCIFAYICVYLCRFVYICVYILYVYNIYVLVDTHCLGLTIARSFLRLSDRNAMDTIW